MPASIPQPPLPSCLAFGLVARGVDEPGELAPRDFVSPHEERAGDADAVLRLLLLLPLFFEGRVDAADLADFHRGRPHVELAGGNEDEFVSDRIDELLRKFQTGRPPRPSALSRRRVKRGGERGGPIAAGSELGSDGGQGDI